MQTSGLLYSNNKKILFATQFNNENTAFHRSSAVSGGKGVRKRVVGVKDPFELNILRKLHGLGKGDCFRTLFAC